MKRQDPLLLLATLLAVFVQSALFAGEVDKPVVLNTEKREFSLPTALLVTREETSIAIGVDATKMEAVKLDVSRGMFTGYSSNTWVYEKGKQRPENASISRFSSSTTVGDGTSFVHTSMGGIPVVGKKYTVEIEFVVFEADVRPGRVFDPKHYKEIWKRTLKHEEQ